MIDLSINKVGLEKKKWLKPAKTAKTLTAENYWKH